MIAGERGRGRRGSRGGLALVAGLVALAGAAVLATSPRSAPDDPSSRSAGPGGTLALYAWLHDGLGIDGVRRLTGRFDLAGLDVLVVHRPTSVVTAEEADAVVGFLRTGGELLLDVDRASLPQAAALLARLGVAPVTGIDRGSARPDQLVDPGGTLGPVPVGPGSVAFATDPDVTPMLVTDGRAVMVGRPLGAGRAYVLGTPYALSNAGLRPAVGDGSGLVLALLERSRGGRIALDEVHHGETAASGAAAIFAGPLGAALGLSAAVLVTALALTGRRLGRPVAAGGPAGPRAVDLVEALAGMYERVHDRRGVANRYAEELRRRVGAVIGVDPHVDDATFAAAVAGFGAERAEPTLRALRRARTLAAAPPRPRDLLDLAREVDDAERLWGPGRGGDGAVATARRGLSIRSGTARIRGDMTAADPSAAPIAVADPSSGRSRAPT